MDTLQWGIIGCGDVTEVKSGPAFNKVPNSKLVAVMRRDASKAADYAARHGVPKWYNDATALIDDPEINAVYIATLPDSHEEYTMMCLEKKKPVYLEKPMTLDAAGAARICDKLEKMGGKISVAHYRRAQPFFKKIKSIIDSGEIGFPRVVNLRFYHASLTEQQLNDPRFRWRTDPKVSGGGLFHDLAPHQLDLLRYFFGEVVNLSGYSVNQGKQYAADDTVSAILRFESGLLANTSWCFCVPKVQELDVLEIIGTSGKLKFSVFGKPDLHLTVNDKTTTISFDPLQHVQQPMISEVVRYFTTGGENPCSADDGLKVMRLMDAITGKTNL